MSAGLQGFRIAMPMRRSASAIAADFFFGAMDGGIDARKSKNRGFYGPYASISVGLGD